MATDDKKKHLREKLVERQNEARVVRKIVFLISSILIFMLVVAAVSGYLYVKSALKPLDPNNKQEKTVEIPIGSSVGGIAQILENEGIIKNAKVFKYYIKFKNEAGFMAGTYDLSPSMTFSEIINELKTGKVLEEPVFKVTIPEGKQLKEIVKIIGEKTNHNQETIWKKLNDKKFIQELMNKYPNLLTDEILDPKIKYPLEGYLFPATYPFYEENPSIEEIVTTMLDKTVEVLNEYAGQMAEREMTPHQLLTMASLIEEEATEHVDRELISGVFYNRLKAGMPLQTDPTVLYAQGEHKEKVYYKDLEIQDPYNTYIHTGLTPGPIANAGVSSIEAALSPAETDYMYFLAADNGEIYFSKTLEEHNVKKAKYIK